MPITTLQKTTITLRGTYSDDVLSLEFDPADLGSDEAVSDVVVTAQAQDKRIKVEFRPEELDSLVRALVAAGFGRARPAEVDEDSAGGDARPVHWSSPADPKVR